MSDELKVILLIIGYYVIPFWGPGVICFFENRKEKKSEGA